MVGIFISHSYEDRRYAEEMVFLPLEARGFIVFPSPTVRQGTRRENQPLRSEVDLLEARERLPAVPAFEVLQQCDWFVVLVSHYATQSERVRAEVVLAESSRVSDRIISVLMEDCDPGSLHPSLRRRRVIDFRGDKAQAQQELLEVIGGTPPGGGNNAWVNLAQPDVWEPLGGAGPDPLRGLGPPGTGEPNEETSVEDSTREVVAGLDREALVAFLSGRGDREAAERPGGEQDDGAGKDFFPSLQKKEPVPRISMSDAVARLVRELDDPDSPAARLLRDLRERSRTAFGGEMEERPGEGAQGAGAPDPPPTGLDREGLVALLSGGDSEAAERLVRELNDPTGPAARLLRDLRERSRTAFGEEGLVPGPAERPGGAEAFEQPSPGRGHLINSPYRHLIAGSGGSGKVFTGLPPPGRAVPRRGSDPGGGRFPHPAIGIDLGTTYSSVACVDAKDGPVVLRDDSERTRVRSAVWFAGDRACVGEAAVQLGPGPQFIEARRGDEWSRPGGLGSTFDAILLNQLAGKAEKQIGRVAGAVITVPAWFTQAQTREVERAAERAGLHILGTLHEPVAAALACGLHRSRQEENVLAWRLGGGTFDVTVLRVAPNRLDEIAISGDTRVGGISWDQCLIDLVETDFKKKHPNHPLDPEQRLALRLECERAKWRLSDQERTSIQVPAFGVSHSVEVSRREFERLTLHLLDATRLRTEMVLEDAGLRWDQISRVLRMGGASHMPMVRRMLEEMCGLPPSPVIPPEAAALGALLYAGILEAGHGPQPGFAGRKADPGGPPPDSDDSTVLWEGTSAPPTLRLVTPHGVGVKVLHEGRFMNKVLIRRNTPVPVEAKCSLSLGKGIRSAEKIGVEITEGDSSEVDEVTSLGTATFAGVPETGWREQPLELTVGFDEQGRLRLEAALAGEGRVLDLSLRDEAVTRNRPGP
jgi:molecular chaperone DnaK